jgi:putative heme iron utilization protein
MEAAQAPPEPPFAERARTLVHLGRVGPLCTQLHDHRPGSPFGSVSPYGVDAGGQPTLLISKLAVHTQNLLADARASLLVAEPGWTGDPLAGARVTLVGSVEPVADGERKEIREDYLERHPSARSWVDFGDFGFHRLRVAELYYVAGFGAMGWVAAEAYRAAAADPLADARAGILAHMNADHADALVLYARAFAAVEAEEAEMVGIDHMGFSVRARVGDRSRTVRIGFPRDVTTPEEARRALVEMVREARSRLGA